MCVNDGSSNCHEHRNQARSGGRNFDHAPRVADPTAGQQPANPRSYSAGSRVMLMLLMQ